MVMECFPEEKVLFASNSADEAMDYFDRQVLHGDGWYELWMDGGGTPVQAGGFSANQPQRRTRNPYDLTQPTP